VDGAGNAGFGNAVVAVLERTAGIDDDAWLQQRQVSGKVRFGVERRMLREVRRQGLGRRLGFGCVAAGNDDSDALAGQQTGDPLAKIAIAAKDERRH